MPDDITKTSLSLIEDAKLGNEAAWSSFVAIYGPIIFRKCRRAGFGENDAEDLSQDIFTKLWLGLSSFRRDPPAMLFRKWLAVLVRNACHDAYGRLKSRPTFSASDFENLCDGLSLRCDEETAFTLQDSDMQQSMRAAMRRVESVTREKHWQAFWKTEVESQSAAEVGQELDLQADNVRQIRKRVFRAIVEETRLMGMLEEAPEQESE